jgi:stalled ribosome rescue protein Dom34
MGGSAQARYQRRTDNFHLHHMKEVADVLERVVRDEVISQIVVACDEVAKPLLMEQLPKHLADRIVDVLKLDINTPEQRVLTETMDALRQKDAETDAARVEEMLGAWRGNGLAVAGPEDTLKALEMGQVEELLITSKDLQRMDDKAVTQANDLVTRAQQSAARIRFIEDPDLLADVRGVGALLRFKI